MFLATMQSYSPEVIADSSGKFFGNTLRFPFTPDGKRAAEDWVAGLAERWTLVISTRVIETTDEPNQSTGATR